MLLRGIPLHVIHFHNAGTCFQELVMAQTTVALRHRDHAAVGLFAKKQMNSTLSSFFFGKDGTNELAVEDFLLFQVHLLSWLKPLWRRVERSRPRQWQLLSCVQLVERFIDIGTEHWSCQSGPKHYYFLSHVLTTTILRESSWQKLFLPR